MAASEISRRYIKNPTVNAASFATCDYFWDTKHYRLKAIEVTSPVSFCCLYHPPQAIFRMLGKNREAATRGVL